MQPHAKIYLGSERGCTQDEWYRGYHTFNFGSYYNPNKKADGSLQVVNDNTLKGGSTLTIHSKEEMWILLLPIVGALKYKNSVLSGRLEVGQSCLVYSAKDDKLEIANPYENILINFLEVRLKLNSGRQSNRQLEAEFDLDSNKNKLISLFPNKQSSGKPPLSLIGKFEGRKEGVYKLKDSKKGIFIFVIEEA